MIVLTANHISKAFGEQDVLQDVNLVVQQGAKFGLVGQNGSGKTTLFRIITGEEQADAGTIQLAAGTRIGYLRQQSDIDTDLTVWEYMRQSFEHLFAMEERLRRLEEKMGEAGEEAMDQIGNEYARLTDVYEEAGGYSWKSSIQGVLNGLMFTSSQYDQPVRSLSGGEKTRLMLARLLTSGAELLMLDEPTNHLDLESTAWLEGYLKTYPGTVLVISHDRYFLDALCTDMGELSFGRLNQYPGGYSRYLELRAEQWERQMKLYQMQQKEIRRQEAIIARYRRFNREKSIRQARSREKLLERMERVERPQEEAGVRFRFEAGGKTGYDVLLADDLSKGFGERTLFSGVDLHLRAGDRVALIGPNGIGKSTLIKILMGRQMPDTGLLQWGAGVRLGYYDQQQQDLSVGRTILEEVREAFPRLSDTDIRTCLGAFLFYGDDVFKRIDTLSGGERARIALVKLILRHDNVLLLDEPTNHLDMDSCEVLEESLDGFTGTLLAVSHDRYFINRIANRVWVMTPEGIVDYPGNYDEYMEKRRQMEWLALEEETSQVTKTVKRQEKRKSREEREKLKQARQALEEAEQRIEAAEAEIARLEAALADPDTYGDPERAQRLAVEYALAKEALPKLYAEWEAHV